MKKILLVEDNNEMNKMLHLILSQDYQVTQAYSGTEGLLYFQNQHFDLIILDRMLPGLSGDELLKKIRERAQVPVLMLTAINDQKDIAALLLAGADDYLTKPFDIDVLKARIIVQLRKTTSTPLELETLTYKNLRLQLATFQLTAHQQPVELKRKEFEILALLLQHPQKVFTKEALYESIWNEPYYGDENTVNVHLSNLRKKLKAVDPTQDYIQTVWGIGVKLADGGAQ